MYIYLYKNIKLCKNVIYIKILYQNFLPRIDRNEWNIIRDKESTDIL